MGFTSYHGFTKQDIIQCCLTGGESPVGFKPLAHSVVGNHLWVAFENKTSERYPKGDRFLCLYLMGGHRGYGWGCKVVDESMGPCDYDCPLYLLDLVPPSDSQYAQGFRNNVRAFHALKTNQRMKANNTRNLISLKDRVTLPEGYKDRNLIVHHISTDRKRILVYSTETNRTYRMTPKVLAVATISTPQDK